MKNLITLIFLSLVLNLSASDARKAYIDKWKDTAIEQMQAYGIPASITLAQGILESGNGRSELTREANNHFGIKCHGWDGPGVYHDDDKRNECFRKYKNAKESFEDHSKFLLKKRYAGLFELNITDYKGWAKGLKKAGYATDPAYAKRLISLIEQNDLDEFDKGLLASRKKPKAGKREKPRTQKTSSSTTSPTASIGAINLDYQRKIEIHPNNIKYVVAQKGDNIESIATELELAEWQIKKYNELGPRKKFKEGEVVFIQPKKKKGKIPIHKAIDGETLRDISMHYGISLKHLSKYNNNRPPDKAYAAGQQVKLKKPKP